MLTDENIGTNDKKGLIQRNGLSFNYKGIQKFFKAVLLSLYGSAYSSHFENASSSEIMKRFVTQRKL